MRFELWQRRRFSANKNKSVPHRYIIWLYSAYGLFLWSFFFFSLLITPGHWHNVWFYCMKKSSVTIHQNIYFYVPQKKSKSYRFGCWVNNDIIFIFRLTVPLRTNINLKRNEFCCNSCYQLYTAVLCLVRSHKMCFISDTLYSTSHWLAVI